MSSEFNNILNDRPDPGGSEVGLILSDMIRSPERKEGHAWTDHHLTQILH
jgi:hypothetical protein